MKLLVRNTVKSFEEWKPLFDQQIPIANEYGLELEHLWRSTKDPNEVFYVFSVATEERANAFMARPESAEVGELSGVLEGAFWFVE